MNVPALAARAPLGATNTTPGTGEARIALITSRIEVSRPPGVSICRMTSSAPSLAARSMPRLAKCALAGPMAPSSGTSTTGAAEATAQAQPRTASRIARIAADYAPLRRRRPYLPSQVLRALRRVRGSHVLTVGHAVRFLARHEAPGACQPVADQRPPASAVLRIEEVHRERAQAQRNECSHARASFTGLRRPATAPSAAARSERSSAPNVIQAARVASGLDR